MPNTNCAKFVMIVVLSFCPCGHELKADPPKNPDRSVDAKSNVIEPNYTLSLLQTIYEGENRLALSWGYKQNYHLPNIREIPGHTLTAYEVEGVEIKSVGIIVKLESKSANDTDKNDSERLSAYLIPQSSSQYLLHLDTTFPIPLVVPADVSIKRLGDRGLEIMDTKTILKSGVHTFIVEDRSETRRDLNNE